MSRIFCTTRQLQGQRRAGGDCCPAFWSCRQPPQPSTHPNPLTPRQTNHRPAQQSKTKSRTANQETPSPPQTTPPTPPATNDSPALTSHQAVAPSEEEAMCEQRR
mmetsp:Transcript_13440/g.25113  ORF Transcript_13440/g.25113 Transcript_13440/m.25113 type:complete len:105 (+) Transcript_13440:1269-1583(+)